MLNNTTEQNMNRRNGMAVLEITAIVITSIITYILGVSSAKLSNREEYVLMCVQDYISQFDRKASFKLKNDILYSRSDEGNIYVIFEYIAGYESDTVYYKDGEFIGTESYNLALREKDDNRDYNSTEEQKAVLNELIDISSAKMELYGYKMVYELSGKERENQEMIKCKRIAKRLGIGYIE